MISKIQKACFSAGLIATIIAFVMKAFYRPYIVANHLYDFGLADHSPSLFYVAGFSLLLLIRWYPKVYLTTLMVTFASIGYEFMQFKKTEILDTGDIIASIAGGIITLLIVKSLKLIYP